MSEDIHCSKSDVLRKAIILFDLALKYSKQGKHLIVVDKNNNQPENLDDARLRRFKDRLCCLFTLAVSALAR